MGSTDSKLDEDAEKLRLARAFDAAWERFTVREGTHAATDDKRKRLAARLVAMAKAGESDEDMLSEAGLIHLCVLAEASRLGQRQRKEAAAQPAASITDMSDAHDVAGKVFAPDAVEAMSAALNLCLDQLPLRIPSDALKLLSTSILEEASRGERDPERLQEHALETLKTRQ
jgi:hypothetical protein